MSDHPWEKSFVQGVLAQIREGTVSIPYLLIKDYTRLNLTEVEVMLLIHLFSFIEKEHNDFPTIEQIQSRMSSSPEVVIHSIRNLIKKGLISIDEEIDPTTGMQSERYNLTRTFEKLAWLWAEQYESMEHHEPDKNDTRSGEVESNVFRVFEQEFGRPLSPMECETIVQWLERDHYSEELILAALKEAVFSGIKHFRYIDRILLEWSRNQVYTAEQAREYTRNFRNFTY